MTSAFQAYIERFFDKKTLNKVAHIFKKLDIPEPLDSTEFRLGCDGALIFSNKHAMTIKIERLNSKGLPRSFKRISHPSILQPVFQEKAGKAMIEIYPGVPLENVSEDDVMDFKDKLTKDGVDFYDYGIRNVGRLPLSTVEFPNGAPVVIDRLSVDLLKTASILRTKLNTNFYEDPAQTGTEQYKLYKPLQQAFKEVLSSNKGNHDAAHKAWQLCIEFKKKGALTTGWLSKSDFIKETHPVNDSLRSGVRSISINYTKRLKS